MDQYTTAFAVIQHLANNLSAQASITLPLHFHEGRDTILVDKEVIDRPPSCATVFGRDRLLAVQEEPAPRCIAFSGIAGEQFRKVAGIHPYRGHRLSPVKRDFQKGLVYQFLINRVIESEH
jgi:hypothetical protein